MTQTYTTASDAITAAMSVAEDVAEGRLAPADLERQAVAELRQLFGTVVGPDDPAWEVQTDVARQAVALGALTADELSEWAAVMPRRAGESLSEPGIDESLPEPVSPASEAHSPDSVDADAELADVGNRRKPARSPGSLGSADGPGDPEGKGLNGFLGLPERGPVRPADRPAGAGPVTEPQPRLSVVADAPQPQRRADGTRYDPLAGWDAGGSRRS